MIILERWKLMLLIEDMALRPYCLYGPESELAIRGLDLVSM